MVWKKVSDIFIGGTQEAKALYGKKIRLVRDLECHPRIVDKISEEKIFLKQGTQGFVGNVPIEHLDQICLGFPGVDSAPVANIEAMLLGRQITVVQINWPTFRHQFEIDV